MYEILASWGEDARNKWQLSLGDCQKDYNPLSKANTDEGLEQTGLH